jgi:hypothetical protein
MYKSRVKGTVIFGLLVATFLTLVVVPVLYFLIERSKELLVLDDPVFICLLLIL